uniref:Uncharacterized protein n=1 Tax=Octopus bimaculoides TaxID=37653 RepID=A0A0L8GHB2_OCTBM
MKKSKDCNIGISPYEIATSEKLVLRTIAAIKCFNNPFSIPDDGKLYNLSSGALASDVAKDVLTAETGGLAKEDFIENRLMMDGFFDPIKHPNLKTMAYTHKFLKVSIYQNKVVEYKQQGNSVSLTSEIPQTFREISRKVLGSVLHLLPLIFRTDMYKEDSVKGVERNRQGFEDKLILSGEKRKHPKVWEVFLANDENKTQFIQLLFTTWRSEVSADIHTGHEMVLICEGKAYQLISDGHNTFCQEIDTRVILYCMYAKEQGCKSVRVRSPDSDIFFILLHYARLLEGLQILVEPGKGITQRCIDVTKLDMSSMRVLSSALLGYHAFTRCNSTSAFKGKGNESFQKAFSKLGESWDVNEEVMNELERFTCVLYGNKRTKKIRIWMLASIAMPSVPRPEEGHGWTMEAGMMKPKWREGEVMPCQLEDILEELEDETCTSDSDLESDCALSESNFLNGVGSDSDTESDGDYYLDT